MPQGGFIDITLIGDDGVTLRRRIQTYSMRLTDHTEPLTQIGKDILLDNEVNFLSSGGLYAGGWAPLAPSTIVDRMRKGFGPGPTLVRTGELRASLTQRGGDNIFEVSKNALSVGSRNWKASIHHRGAPRARIPARRLVGLSWGRRQGVVRVFADWVHRLWQEGR